MFRHKGKGRTYSHNLKLASILSGVAGTVNITGVLSVGTLTTNVTGHFAFFSEALFLRNYRMALVYILYILSFLLGALVSGLLTELVGQRKYKLAYIFPLSIEIVIFTWGGLIGLLSSGVLESSAYLSLALLFSMGMQNALVTNISQSVVRTTHLTGLFTDLGIELSHVILYRRVTDKQQLFRNIFLKFIIIICFFTGGITGGFLYMHFGLQTLLFPAALLLFVLWYDRILFRYYHLKRKLRQ